MDKLNFIVRRNLVLLAEARDRMMLALSAPTPGERRIARVQGEELARVARLALASELDCEPQDIPWAAARAKDGDVRRLIAEQRKKRQDGALSLDGWSETLTMNSARSRS